jgi:hypothetical protein
MPAARRNPTVREEVFHNCRTALVTTDDPTPIRNELSKQIIDVNEFGYFGNDRRCVRARSLQAVLEITE